jgi:hypothetical protein
MLARYAIRYEALDFAANLTAMSSPRPKLPAAVIALGITSLLADVSSEMIAPLMPLFLTATLGAGALQLADGPTGPQSVNRGWSPGTQPRR